MLNMPVNGQEVVYEGWLTKSPPTKRIWRARWRRRWFSLRHSGELPGQFHLTYYTDRNCRKLKGIIDLDHCEQVDLGLKHEEKKLKFDHVFDIKTPTRTYYLAADSEREMKSWVNCICKVCGLKSTNDEEDCIVQRSINRDAEGDIVTFGNVFSNDSPSISPVSTSPYIPISECISGRSPISEAQDFKTLLEYNLRNSILHSDLPQNHLNETYELSQRSYLNYVNCESTSRFYDCPRQLAPYNSNQNVTSTRQEETNFHKDQHSRNASPLQSPTDSESVFTDDDWVVNTHSDLNCSKTSRPSDSSTDIDMTVTQKFTKLSLNDFKCQYSSAIAPPRPPKPINKTPNYFNLESTLLSDSNKDLADIENSPTPEIKSTSNTNKVLSDDMYDFPRSHNMDIVENSLHVIRRHCYNNAAPITLEGQVFRYDISPKPGTSASMFRYDSEDIEHDPASPLSQGSSTTLYSNLPSPCLPDSQGSSGQLMPPPIVNRYLKPKRKLSDSLSTSLSQEPLAPSVDRKLKPTPQFQSTALLTNLTAEDEIISRKVRVAPSHILHTGLSLENLYQNNDQQIYHYLPGNKNMQYLDLDLEGSSSMQFTDSTNSLPLRSTGAANTVYKKVDFMKTEAFNITRNNLEKERKETVTYVKK